MSVLTHIPATPRLSHLAQAAEGQLHGVDQVFATVGIDTRRLAVGDVFVALHGRHDGHAHVAQAATGGAAGALVERVVEAPLAQIEVTDTQAALQRAGAAWRQAFAGAVVGITGSNGKTTVRRMLTAILEQSLAPVLASAGNFNNHLGVPLTLLGLRAGHASAVLEMGANHAGEIEQLTRLVRPRVGVITNAGDAHLEGFGSRHGVARGKGELYAQLAPDAVAVINADDTYAGQWQGTAAHCHQLMFSLDGNAAEVMASDVVIEGAGSRFTLILPSGQTSVTLAFPGEHNVRNALAAAAAATALGVSAERIAAGLAQATPEAGRLVPRVGLHGAHVVDDSYNANPASLHAGLAWLARQSGPRWLVLGDMAELGAAADAAHEAAGRHARAAGIERVWATGPESRLTVDSFGEGGAWFADRTQLLTALQAALAAQAAPVPTILVKGSRSAHMDHVVAHLTAAAAGGASC